MRKYHGTLGLLVTGLFLNFVATTSAPEEIWISPSTSPNSNETDPEEVTRSPHPQPSLLLGPISKSPLDRRAYRALLLQNGVKVILVSDPNTTRAAASLAFPVGSMDDPPTLMGLAHFLEHMLFLGNRKYPQENGFQKWISEHGGHSNAATQPDKTYYFFRVSPPALKDSLERFAHLFISPLLTESALEREVLAVDSEHQKYLPDDRRRLERIEAATGRRGHPFTKYRTGSKETLWTRPKAAGIDIRSALATFHQTHYTASGMHLSVLGSEGLNELQTIVEDIFLQVPSNGSHTPDRNLTQIDPLYGEEELGERIEIVPLGNFRSLQLIFPVPYIPQYYKNTALGYISHLMGQEGPGSLSAYLKRKHWAESVTVGGYLPTQGLTFFKAKIALTQEGLGNVNQLVKHVFQYIAMMREEGPQLWFWEEVRDINLLHFRFRDEVYPMELVSKLSVNMIQYPVEKVLHAVGIDEGLNFDAAAINKTLTFLTPENCRLFVTSSEFENKTLLREEYVGIHYNRRKLAPEVIEDWGSCTRIPEFHLPHRNEFVPSKFDLKPRDDLSLQDPFAPRKLVDSNFSQLWYLQDSTFLLPKATVLVELLSPLAYADLVRTNLLSLWYFLITESLMEFQYSARLAGLESEVVMTEGGLMITVRGYDHKLAQFVRKIFLRILTLSTISTSSEGGQSFAKNKDTLLRVLRNRDQDQPYELANAILRLLLLDRRWPDEERIEAHNELTLEKLQQFVTDFLSRLKFRWIFYGNLTPLESTRIATECEALFISHGTRALFPSQRSWLPTRVVELPPGSNWLYVSTTPSSSSSCTMVLFQIGLDSTHSSVLASLLSRIAHQHLFDQLRTKEALGYAVWTDSYTDKFYATLSFRVVVEGSQPPAFVEERIANFLHEFEGLLGNMTEKEFLRHRKSLGNALSTPPKTMNDKMRAIHREVVSGRGNFHWIQVEVKALEGITLKDLRDFYRDTVTNPETRRKLSIHVESVANLTNGTVAETNWDNATLANYNDSMFSSTPGPEMIEDIPTWKETMKLFPSLNPFQVIPHPHHLNNGNVNDTN